MPPDKDNPDDISKLLRLKRFEQPGPEYFEGFLRDFHRRQREEVLRPLWRIALDRAGAFFGGDIHREIIGYGTAAAAAVVLFLGVVNFESVESGKQPVAAASAEKSPDTRTASANMLRTEQPRYVIDTRPVSYHEPPFSF